MQLPLIVNTYQLPLLLSQYDAHWDYFFHKEGTSNGGNRYATVLTYLADTEEGGETIFPNIPAPGGRNDDSFSECARYHLAAKARKGTAVLFHSIKPNGEVGRDVAAACPFRFAREETSTAPNHQIDFHPTTFFCHLLPPDSVGAEITPRRLSSHQGHQVEHAQVDPRRPLCHGG